MLLSIEDIKSISFRRAGFGGYKPEDVETFINEVLNSYKALTSNISKLQSEIDNLNKEVNKYREEESCIRKAILSAQKLADASIIEANSKAKEILADASERAEKTISDAKLISEKEIEKAEKLRSDVNVFKDGLIKSYNEHIKSINDMTDDINNDELLSINESHEDNNDIKLCDETSNVSKETDVTEECAGSKESGQNSADDSKCKFMSGLEPDNDKYKEQNLSLDYKVNSSVYKSSFSNIFSHS